MSALLDTILFSFSITGPIFVVLVLGALLYQRQMITDNFIEVGSRLVFNVTLPALLFISISQTSIEQAANLRLIATAVVGTLVSYALLELLVARVIPTVADRGVVVQGGFRANMGIIGLAYCFNAYGNAGLAGASIYLAAVTVLYNILAVITLNRWLRKDRGLADTLRGIVRNPLIIGIVLALPFAWTGVQLPQLVIRSGEYFAQMTLPLALLCAGASLNMGALRNDIGSALVATVSKLLLMPLLMIAAAIMLDFGAMDMGILVLMSSAPTASASYIMVRAMGGNAPLAANIIVLTTLASLFSTSLLITLLRTLELM